MKRERVVVTGLGVVSSLGIGKDIFWENLIQGKSGISEVDAFDTTEFNTHYGGEVKNFKAEDFLNKRKIKLMGRSSQFAIAAAELALKDAKINMGEHYYHNVSTCIGTTGGEVQEMEKIDVIWVKEGSQAAVDNWSITHYPVDNLSCSVAKEFKLTGPNYMFTTACAAGNYAIGYGFDILQLGKADMVIVGGAEAFSYLSFAGFCQLGLMASRRCQPFDKNRRGILLSEGAGILILERLESALKRDAYVYAEILGYGLSCDAYHMTNPHFEGLAKCISNALKSAGITSRDVDYINVHGTGTRNNDKAECMAIKKVFSDKIPLVSSIKAMLGHSMGAAPAIEAVACCLTLQKGIIPPTMNYETPDPECDIDCVPNQARKQDVNIVLNNSLAFWGNNCCIAFGRMNR